MPASGVTYGLGQQVKVPWLPYAFRIAGGGGGGMITGTQRHVRSTTIAGQTPPADVAEAGTFDQPYATLDYAISRCTANANEWIWVHGAHAETIIADSGVDVDIAGITVAWTGQGPMPTFTFATAAAADFKMAAASCRVFGLRFLCNITVQGMIIEWSADDCEMAWCEFREGTQTGLNFISIGLADGDSDRFYIHHNTVHAPTAGNYAHAITVLFDMAGGRLEDNIIYGDFDEAGIDIPAGGNAQVNLSIRRNTITNLQAGQHAIQVNGTTSRGVIEDTTAITDAVATAIDPGGLALVGRNEWNVIGNSDFISVPVFMPSDQVTNPIGIDDADNAFASTNVASNADGSVLERQEYLQTTQAVPVADAVTNVLMRDVVGIKTDAGVQTVGATSTLMAYIKAILDQLSGTAGLTTFPAEALAANAVSLAEVLRWIQNGVRSGTGTALATNESLVDILYAANGIAVFPAAALPANNVSIAEVLREAYDQQEKAVVNTTAVLVSGTTIFTIAGGPIEILSLVARCVTGNDGTASTLQWSADPTDGAAATFSGVSASLANAAAGAMAILQGTALTTAPIVNATGVGLSMSGATPTLGIIVGAGIITTTIGVGSTTGTWQHHLRFRPLSRGVTVT